MEYTNHAELRQSFDLALDHQRAGRGAEAETLYRQILEVAPSFADAWNNLGVALEMRGELEAAADAFSRAIVLQPQSVEVYAHLGHALRESGRLDEAIDAYRRGLLVRPDPRLASSLLLAMHAHPAHGRRELFDAHADWDRAFAQPLRQTILPHGNERSSNRTLRVGYVAADLGNQPLGRFLLPLLENHDRARFDTFCYCDNARPDAVSVRLRAAAAAWRDTRGMSDEQLAAQIRDDRVNILIDLTMHAAGSRLLAFARKPAPVQATYLAYCSTTGLRTIDYRLSDPHLDPPGIDESLYSEHTLRLPRTWWCYPEPPEAPPVSPPPAERTGHLTFGCLNSFTKVTPEVMSLWAEVMRRIPTSRLILHSQAGGHRARTLSLFAENGVDPARIEFVGHLPLADYFATYARIDLCLDAYPWAGGATTCDALWMGVPVVTLAGETAVSRGGLSILSNIGLPDLAATRPERFIDIATGLGLPRLRDLRANLRDRMRASALMDAPAFARDVEAAYLTMWERWITTSS